MAKQKKNFFQLARGFGIFKKSPRSIFKDKITTSSALSNKERKAIQQQTGLSKQQVLRLARKYSRQFLKTPYSQLGKNISDKIPTNLKDANPIDTTAVNDVNKLDPKLGSDANNVDTKSSDLADLAKAFTELASGYQSKIDDQASTIKGYEDDIGGYQSDLSDMAEKLKDTSASAKEFQRFDTQYLSNNTAGGVRLRRSKNFRKNLFALGASGLNRKNRTPFKVSNVNL